MPQLAFRRSSILALPFQVLQLDPSSTSFLLLCPTVLCFPTFTDWISGLLSDLPISRSSLVLSIEDRDSLKGSSGTSLREVLPDLEIEEGRWDWGSLLAGGSPECRMAELLFLTSLSHRTVSSPSSQSHTLS